MNKLESTLLIAIVIAVFIFINTKSFAAYELQNENLSLVARTGSVTLRHGNFVVTNQVLTNGDIIETNSFVPDIPPSMQTTQSSGTLFSALLNQLIADNSVNVGTFVGDTTGQSSVYLPGEDTTITDIPSTATATSTSTGT